MQLEARRASIIVITIIECFAESCTVAISASQHASSQPSQPNDVACIHVFLVNTNGCARGTRVNDCHVHQVQENLADGFIGNRKQEQVRQWD